MPHAPQGLAKEGVEEQGNLVRRLLTPGHAVLHEMRLRSTLLATWEGYPYVAVYDGFTSSKKPN